MHAEAYKCFDLISMALARMHTQNLCKHLHAPTQDRHRGQQLESWLPHWQWGQLVVNSRCLMGYIHSVSFQLISILEHTGGS